MEPNASNSTCNTVPDTLIISNEQSASSVEPTAAHASIDESCEKSRNDEPDSKAEQIS